MNPGLNFGSPSGYLSVNYSPVVGQGKVSGGLYFSPPPPRQLEKGEKLEELGGSGLMNRTSLASLKGVWKWRLGFFVSW